MITYKEAQQIREVLKKKYGEEDKGSALLPRVVPRSSDIMESVNAYINILKAIKAEAKK